MVSQAALSAPPGLVVRGSPVDAGNPILCASTSRGVVSEKAQSRKLRRVDAIRRSMELQKISMVSSASQLEHGWRLDQLDQDCVGYASRFAALEAQVQFLAGNLASRVGELEVLVAAVSTEAHSTSMAHGRSIQRLESDLECSSSKVCHLEHVLADPWFGKIAGAMQCPDSSSANFPAGGAGTEAITSQTEILSEYVEAAKSRLEEFADSLIRRYRDDGSFVILHDKINLATDVILGKRCACVLTALSSTCSEVGWHVEVHGGTESWFPPSHRCRVKACLERPAPKLPNDLPAWNLELEKLKQIVNSLAADVDQCKAASVPTESKDFGRCRDLEDRSATRNLTSQASLEDLTPVIQRLVMGAVSGLARECDKEFTRINSKLSAPASGQ